VPENANVYRGHRLPTDVIAHTVQPYARLALSFRDVEALLAEGGVTVSYETVRRWIATFGAQYAEELCRRASKAHGRTWDLGGMAVRIGGRQQWFVARRRRARADARRAAARAP
jgi:putative transposase